MQIIVIDDETTNCKLLEIYVNKWNYNSISFSDSYDAYKYLQILSEPAIVCIDWMMPGMTGLDVITKIRMERPDFPIYFIVLTAKLGQGNIVEALDAGADDYVAKPFDSKELKSRIGAGKRVLDLEFKLVEKDLKLQKINNTLQSTLNTIEQDIQAGKIVQFKLLPTNNKVIDGYTFSYFLEPSLYLSGDFLDYYSINGRFVGFYFIDVSGHGASSAFITIYVKNFFSNFISKYKKEKDKSILNPEFLVRKLNKRLVGANLGKHLTIFTGIIDKENNELIYCNGGQFPFPIIQSTDGAQFLDKKGFPVGLMLGAKYKNEKISLPDKFNFLLFSDGLLEILPVKGLKEQQKYILNYLSNYNISYKDLLEKISFNSKIKDLPDDITCMVITNGENNA